MSYVVMVVRADVVKLVAGHGGGGGGTTGNGAAISTSDSTAAPEALETPNTSLKGINNGVWRGL